MTRWVMAIQEYDFTINYCKAADNQVADALSRYPQVTEEHHSPGDQDVKILSIKYTVLQQLEHKLKRIQAEQS